MFANPIMLPFVMYQRWLELFFFPSSNKAKTADAAMDNVKSIQIEAAQNSNQIAKAPTRGRRMPYISARIHKARK